ncbi:hypothetical protein CBP35_16960 [Acidovorax carolinensis]|nr:hypothetical protein CBP35_16960 [Acidovorax carolinensis]
MAAASAQMPVIFSFAMLVRRYHSVRRPHLRQLKSEPFTQKFGHALLPPSSTTEITMATTQEYLSRSRLFRRLRSGIYGPFIELYGAGTPRGGRALQTRHVALPQQGQQFSWLGWHP